MLRVIAAEFQDEELGLATCPYRAVAGRSFWSTLEAAGLNTEFISGILVARMIEGMKFAVGPTIVARRRALERIGGFDRLKDYLAEDFVMGRLVAESGERVILSSYVIEHRIGSQAFGPNLRHRLRWNRSTRRSRPWGYAGQVFTNPLPLALILLSLRPDWWPMFAAAVGLRAAAGWTVARWVLRLRLSPSWWLLLAAQDIAGFLMWMAGFFGKTILWRGRKYYLLSDGTFKTVPLPDSRGSVQWRR
jgi:ceramide glucosyltransferase